MNYWRRGAHASRFSRPAFVTRPSELRAFFWPIVPVVVSFSFSLIFTGIPFHFPFLFVLRTRPRYPSPFPHNLSILTLIKNESLYISEWLEYHLLVGADHFWIVNNESGDNISDVLAPYIAMGLVDLSYWPGQSQQIKIYNKVIKQVRWSTFWLALIDADEFLVPMHGRSVPVILHLREYMVGIHVQWMVFGANEQQHWECRLVLERFQNHTTANTFNNGFTKLILNPRKVRFMHFHWADYWRTHYPYGRTLCGRRETYEYQSLKKVRCYEELRLNHYFTKSRDEWELKRNRGRASGLRKYDDAIKQLLDVEHDSLVDWAVPIVKNNLKLRRRWPCEP
jgi:hypothetical protein